MIIGTGCIAQIIWSLLDGKIIPNVGIIGIWIGLGLLRFSRGWRTCAFVFLSTVAVATFLLLLLGLKHARLDQLLLVSLIITYALWMLYILLRPDVCDFYKANIPSDVSQPRTTPLPLTVKVVASVFLVIGVCCAAEIVVAILQKRLSFNIGILGIWIGIGLFQQKQGWWICALASLGIALCGTLAAITTSLQFVTIKHFAIIALIVSFIIWQIHILLLPQNKVLFDKQPRPPEA